MPEPRTATVVVVNYRSGRDLERLVDQLLTQQGITLDIRVVDSGSEDGSTEFLARVPEVQLVDPGRNVGYAGGNNLGALGATGEAIVIVNPDVSLSEPGTLSRLIDCLDDDPSCAIVAPTIRLPDGTIEYTESIADFARARVVHLGGGLRVWPPSAAAIELLPWVNGACLAVRPAVWRELGGLDESFFLLFEETDLCLRASGRGHQIGLVTSVEITHRRDSSFTGSSKGVRYYWRNLYLLSSRHATGRWRLGYLLALGRFVTRKRHLVNGFSRRALAGAADALLGRLGALPEDSR